MTNTFSYRFKFTLLILIFLIQDLSCTSVCKNPEIIHLDFCDFLNDVSSEWDKAHSKIDLEKSDQFIINNKNTNCLSPQIVEDFIKNDKFTQREINNGYYRLDLTFYKKSDCTDMLLKSKSSRNLDYCEKDIYIEYLCINGKITDTIYYEDGNIKGSEKIHLDNLRDSSK